MLNALIVLAALGFVGYLLWSMLMWITAGDDWPGEWENPLIDLDQSEFDLKKKDGKLQINVNLRETKHKMCILITTKHIGEAIHVLIQKADPPEGILKLAYTMTDRFGKYSTELRLKPGVTKVLYGPDKVEISI